MKLKDIEYFYQLSQLNSFTRVAKYFGVSQPTISYAIKRLEDKLECDLIVKDPSHRSVALTRQGEIFAAQAEEIINLVSNSVNKVKESLHPDITIGFPPMISNYIFQTLSGRDYDLEQLSTYKFVRGGSNDLLVGLEEGKFDLSVLGSLEPIQNPHLEITPLFTKEFYIVVSKRHPLALHQQIAFRDVLKEKFVLLDSHNVHLTAFNRLNHLYRDQIKPALMLDDLAAIKQIVKQNKGISFLSGLALSKADEKDLVKLPLVNNEKMTFYISYAYPKNLSLPKELEGFIKLIQRAK